MVCVAVAHQDESSNEVKQSQGHGVLAHAALRPGQETTVGRCVESSTTATDMYTTLRITHGFIRDSFKTNF